MDPRGVLAQADVERVAHAALRRDDREFGLCGLARGDQPRGLRGALEIFGWQEVAQSDRGAEAVLELDAEQGIRLSVRAMAGTPNEELTPVFLKLTGGSGLQEIDEIV